MSTAIDRQQIERELRKTMPGTFDLQSPDVQRNLVDTRIRNLQATQTATPAEAAAIRVRQKPAPLHLTPPPLQSRHADETALRNALRDAQAAYQQCQRKSDQLRAVVERAQDSVNTHQAQLTAFAELNDEITALRVKQLKEGAFENIPYQLQHALTERAQKLDEIEISTKALDSLTTEATAAETAATIAHERVLYACRDIVFATAWRLYQELREAEDCVNSIRSLLASCRLIGVPGVPPMHLPAEILDAIAKKERPEINEHSEFTGIWNGYALRLRDDADAKPDTDLLLDDADC